MGKRAWLNEAIATDYLPFLASLDDNDQGQIQAEQFNQDIRNSWSARGLTELSQQQSLMDTTRKAIKNYLGEKHFSLNYIKFSTSEYIILNDTKQGRVAERNEQVQFLDDPDALVGKAIALLKSPEWSEIAAGLSVLTGRRSSELLSTAQFTKCSKWSVTFTGALKRRGETKLLSIEIPTLAPADAVCKALAKVRQQLPEAVGLDAETVNSKYGNAVIRACDYYFTDLVPLREGKDNLYTHLNRSIYATIATFWYCPPNINDVEFKAAIQGHYAILDEKDEQRKRSLTASRHYSDYEMSNAVIARYEGKRKGIKLDLDGVQIINEFQKQIEATTEKPKQKKKLSSVRIWREDKLLLDEIFAHLGLDEPLNQSDKMGELLLWVSEHLEDELKTSLLEPETIETPETILEIPLQMDQLINETIITLGSPDALNTATLNESSQPSSPIVTASGLEAKIDKLVDVMTQFISFQMKQARPPQTTVKVSPQVKLQTASDSTKMANSFEGTTQQRLPRNSPEAEEAIASAINAIIAHNNATELHDLKWAISINAVKELVSDVTKSQRLVQKAIAQRQDEIDQHHSQHQLELSHNHRHKRKRTIREAIPFPSAQT